MPSPVSREAEAVARGRRRRDAPARRRDIRPRLIRWSQQEKRDAGIGGGQVQTLADEKIEIAVHQAGHRAWHARSQDFFNRPERLLVAVRLHKDDASGIETKAVQAMAMQRGEDLSARGDEEGRFGINKSPEQGDDEPTGGRHIGCGPGQDFMHGGEKQTALRKKNIQFRQAEGENPAGDGNPFLPRHQPA